MKSTNCTMSTNYTLPVFISLFRKCSKFALECVICSVFLEMCLPTKIEVFLKELLENYVIFVLRNFKKNSDSFKPFSITSHNIPYFGCLEKPEKSGILKSVRHLKYATRVHSRTEFRKPRMG